MIRVVRNGTTLAAPFLDISADVERRRRARPALDGLRARLRSVRAVLRLPRRAEPDGRAAGPRVPPLGGEPRRRRPAAAGSCLVRRPHRGEPTTTAARSTFGRDGYLWFATGDGGGGDDVHDHARNLGSPLGKVLRIDPRAGNAGRATRSRPAARSARRCGRTGLRNPFRFSFDRVHRRPRDRRRRPGRARGDRLGAAAPGLGRGANYGWPCREGIVAGPTPCTLGASYFTDPVFDYDAGRHAAVTGGVVVRDPGLPTLRRPLRLRRLLRRRDPLARHSRCRAPPTTARRGSRSAPNLAAFGEDACGHVYVVSINGSVDRVQDGALGAVRARRRRRARAAPARRGARPAALPDRTSPRVQHPRRAQGPRRPPRDAADPRSPRARTAA